MRRQVAIWSVVWLLVVAVASYIAWLVINQAGRDVLSGPAADVTVAASPAPASQPPSPGATATGQASTTSATRAPRVTTVQVTGGSVSARCDDDTPVFVSALPRDGWTFDVEHEHGKVEAKFSRGDQESEVHLVCVNGVPVAQNPSGADR